MTSVPDDEVPVHLRPGNVLARKYRVDDVLGVGGMGFVLAATHVTLGERVALKLLLPAVAKQPDAAARFLREARASVRIKDEHVARVLDVDRLESGEPYMVMELLEGSDLSTLLENRGRLSVASAVDAIVQACSALHEAHAFGIVHRDLKPANLFSTVARDGSALVKVVDFGISKNTSDATPGVQTDTNSPMGSALYMSPEQMTSPKGVDHRTDIYSLGVTLFELLTGEAPFMAETIPALCVEVLHGTPRSLAELRPDIPAELVVEVERAFSRKRELRHQGARDLAVAIAPFGSAATRALADRLVREGAATGSEKPTGSLEHVALDKVPARDVDPSQVTTLMHASLAQPPRRTPARTPLLVGGLVIVAGIGVGAFLAFGRKAPTEASRDAVAPATAEMPSSSPSTPVSAPRVEPEVAAPADAASASPSPSGSASPSSAASAPRSAVSARRPAPRPPPSTSPTSPASPAATPPPPPATTPKSIYDGRR